MRSANTISTATGAANTRLGSPELRERMAQLLDRYPKISEAETQELITFLRSGPHLDVGLVTGDVAYRAKAEEIRSRHRTAFRPKVHEALLFVLFMLGPFIYLAVKYLL